MTSRPRLLAAPALLVVAACGVLVVALSDPEHPVRGFLLVAAALLVVIAAGLALWSVQSLATDLDRSEGVAAAQTALLDDVFAAHTASVLIVTDEAGQIVRFNPGAEAVIGVPEAATRGRTPSFFLDETELASWALAMRTDQHFAAVAAGLVASDQQQPLDWPFQRPDGERRLLSMTITALRGPDGEVTGYLCVGRDVTRDDDVESGTEQFLSSMSLELRAPMASILGYAEMLQEELPETGETAGARTFVDRIERNGQRMLLLIQDLLTLTRVEDPDLELFRSEVDLRSLVSRAYDDLQVRAEDRRLDLSLRLPPDPVRTLCDAKLVEQAVTHLVINAAKFTPDGGRILVSLKSNGPVGRIVVGDTGLGISQTDRERLFTRFFRSHQPEVQEVQGSGLGLAIVQAVAAAHGGSVTVDSELGRGSTFVLELPCLTATTPSAGEPVGAAPTMTV